MAAFEIYRHIRQKALIFGLTVNLFAVQMLAILLSLLILIFSFSLSLLAILPIVNSGLYLLLRYFLNNPGLKGLLPKGKRIYSGKNITPIYYEQD